MQTNPRAPRCSHLRVSLTAPPRAPARSGGPARPFRLRCNQRAGTPEPLLSPALQSAGRAAKRRGFEPPATGNLTPAPPLHKRQGPARTLLIQITRAPARACACPTPAAMHAKVQSASMRRAAAPESGGGAAPARCCGTSRRQHVSSICSPRHTCDGQRPCAVATCLGVRSDKVRPVHVRRRATERRAPAAVQPSVAQRTWLHSSCTSTSSSNF